IVRVAAVASGAEAARLWGADGVLVAAHGDAPRDEALAEAALRVLASNEFLESEELDSDELGTVRLVSVRLGEPPLGVLQLVIRHDPDAAGLRAFALRAANAL